MRRASLIGFLIALAAVECSAFRRVPATARHACARGEHSLPRALDLVGRRLYGWTLLDANAHSAGSLVWPSSGWHGPR